MLTIIGEALIDIVRRDGSERSFPGGSPFNVAIGLARLDQEVQFIGRIGQDEHGALLTDALTREGVRVVLPPVDAPTSTAAAVIDDAGAASYDFRIDWSLPALQEAAPEVLAGSTVVHTGSIASVLEPGCQEVERLFEGARASSTLTFDPNCRPSITTDPEAVRGTVERFAALADVVKASDEDLEWLYPGADPLDSARRWRELGPALVVVTRGGEGPWAVSAAGECAVPAPRVTVADTVGAGDSFMAALISGIADRGMDGAAERERLRSLTSEDLEELLRECATAAAVTVSRHGAQPPRRSEL